MVEAAKLAFADREAWYGDDADGAAGRLLSPATRRPAGADRRRRRAGAAAGLPGRARARGCRTTSGGRGGRGDGARAAPGSASRRSPRRATRGDTCHVDVVDAVGNMVSATPSGGWLQSSPTIPELGFRLGTRAQMSWLEDGLPSSLAPGRRPRTTLSPTLVLRDGEPVLAFGTPGGDQQDQWQLCFRLAHTVGGLDLQAAIDAPAWHSTSFPSSFAPRGWVPGEVVVEARLGPARGRAAPPRPPGHRPRRLVARPAVRGRPRRPAAAVRGRRPPQRHGVRRGVLIGISAAATARSSAGIGPTGGRLRMFLVHRGMTTVQNHML